MPAAAAAAAADQIRHGHHNHGHAFHNTTVTMPSNGSSRETGGRDVDRGRREGDRIKMQHMAAQNSPILRFAKRYRTEVAASMSSALSTAAAFPLDSVKTRMQTYKYSGFIDCVRHTYQTEKLRGFFRGTSASVRRPWGPPSLCVCIPFLGTLDLYPQLSSLFSLVDF